MTVVAVTRNGKGDLYRFDSFDAADEHPLIQYGDAIVTEALDIPTLWSPVELPALLRKVGEDEEHVGVVTGTWWDRVWDKMLALASEPPENPGKIISLILEDRRTSRKDGRTMAEEKKTAAAAAAATGGNAAKTPKEKKPKAPKAPKVARPSGVDMDAVIKFGVDAENKPYNATDNNPKARGAGERFAKYRDGMTVRQAVDATGGPTVADVKWDVSKGFITLINPAPSGSAAPGGASGTATGTKAA